MIVAGTTAITGYQAVLSRRALDQATAQQRAWLKVNLEPLDDISIDEQHGLLAALELNVTNVGVIPAEQAWGEVSLHVVDLRESSVRIIPAENGCAVNRHPKFTMNEATVFPGETVSLLPQFVGIDAAELRESSSPNPLGVSAVACVTYSYGGKKEVHLTRTNFLLRPEPTKTGHIYFNLKGDEIPKGRVVIAPSNLDNIAD